MACFCQPRHYIPTVGVHLSHTVGLQPNSDTKLQKLKCRLLTCNDKNSEYANNKYTTSTDFKI